MSISPSIRFGPPDPETVELMKKPKGELVKMYLAEKYSRWELIRRCMRLTEIMQNTTNQWANYDVIVRAATTMFRAMFEAETLLTTIQEGSRVQHTWTQEERAAWHAELDKSMELIDRWNQHFETNGLRKILGANDAESKSA